MLHFKYKAVNQNSKTVQGRIVSVSRGAALEEVKQRGLYVLEMAQFKPWRSYLDVWVGRPFKQKEFILFCRQLAVLLQSGSTLTDSLQLLINQVESRPFKHALTQVYQDVKAGSSFSEACSKHPKLFENIFVNMVRAGELSGNLDELMEKIAYYYERVNEIREKVKSALTYPIIVACISILVVLFLLTQVIPTFIDTLTASGADIPLPTRIVLSMSDILTTYWYVFVLLIVMVIALYFAVRRHDRFRYYKDLLMLKTPIFGTVVRKSAIARMCRTLSILFVSAVPILQALTMVAEIVKNEVMSSVLRNAKRALQKGESLSGPLRKGDVFPPLVVHMVQVGEESGQMDVMLAKVAQFYEEDVNHFTSRLGTILEPLMIIVLAVIVGTIVLATLLPLFTIYQNV